MELQKKINLLADDGILVLKWAKSTLDIVKEVLDEFHSISNLKVNPFKSSIIPIGPSPLDRSQLENEATFPLNRTGKFTYLGIDVPTSKATKIKDRLFEVQVSKIKEIAVRRSSPIHTLLGRVLNVKSLLVSCLTYKFSCAPSPSQQWFKKLQAYLNKYVWSNCPKIAAALAYQPISSGGIDMINVALYEKAIKLSWLFKAVQNPQAWYSLHLQHCLPVSLNQFLTLNLRKSHLKRFLLHQPSPFWKCVLEHYCDVHFTKTGGHLGLMPIAYNSVLAAPTQTTLFRPTAIASLEEIGIYSVSDLVEIYDSLSYKTKRKLGITMAFKRIPNEWMTQIDSGHYGQVPPIEAMATEPIAVSQYYSLLIQNNMPAVNRAINQWEWDLECSISPSWKKVCLKYSLMVRVKLHSFYIKYINRTFHLNHRRAKYVPNCSSKCSFCAQEDERFMHFFWYCPKVQNLWGQLINWCQKNVSDKVVYSKINCLILGFDTPVLDMIMTICKYHIYLLRFHIGSFTIEDLLSRINSVRSKDWMAYNELPYLSINTIKKCWHPLTRKNFA